MAYPYDYLSPRDKEGGKYDDPSYLVGKGAGTKKVDEALERIRKKLSQHGEIFWGEPRLVDDNKSASYPASRYINEGVYNTARRDQDFDAAYIQAIQLGLSDQDAKAVARLRIGQDATQATAKNTMVRQARPDTELTPHREELIKRALAGMEPDHINYDAPLDGVRHKLVRPDLNLSPKEEIALIQAEELMKYGAASGDTFDIPANTPEVKKVIQQVKSTPTPPITPTGRSQYAGKLAKFLIPLITGSSAGYLLSDALQEAEKEEVAELLNQPIS